MTLSRKIKISLFVLIIIGAVVALVIDKVVYKSHAEMEDLQTQFSGNSTDFLKKVNINYQKWQNTIVQLDGIISSIDQKGISLNDHKIYCHFSQKINTETLIKGTSITIRGRVIGYDDLLEELKLDKTIIVSP